jgi:radical SAM protein with 4Fe4S-binding SPASM domain
MKSSNRRWQNHLRAKGMIPFLLDRLQAHSLSSKWQHDKGAFDFPIDNREDDDELTKAFFELTEYFPYEFYLEITNACNLECVMCARNNMKRPRGFMSNELFKKTIDEIVKKQPYAYIHYYGIGESLLDKNLFQKLEYAYINNVRNSILFTNGQLLTQDDTYKKLADSGVAIIGVDIDGFSQETYEQIRIGGDFKALKDGIENLYNYVRKCRLNTRVELAYHIYNGVNEKEIDIFVEWCEENGFEYKLVTMHNWAGLRKDVPSNKVDGLIDQHHMKRFSPCSALWAGFSIAWDGRVGLCFQDADLCEEMGNINEQTIEDIWMGKHLQKRREHINGNYRGLCAKCSSLTEVNLPGKASRLIPQTLRGAGKKT